uniref:Uncharacterized protein n=1 Tax=Rhipicephalus microplus TaxID=6941 RepID=A0A6G5A3F4_RHIMP
MSIAHQALKWWMQISSYSSLEVLAYFDFVTNGWCFVIVEIMYTPPKWYLILVKFSFMPVHKNFSVHFIPKCIMRQSHIFFTSFMYLYL